MSNYKGHLAGGAVSFALMFYFFKEKATLVQSSVWFLCTLAGALFPDVDTKSKGQKYFYHIMFVVLISLLFFEQFPMFIFLSLISLMPLLVKHRGIFHNMWFLICMPLCSWVVISIKMPGLSTEIFFSMLFFIGGAMSHLFLDRGIWRIRILRKHLRKF